ncbi:hypothetical protein [Myceligenerans xiligouense]|uniref:Uncharacterized protein n=1 Tax=Myceligenerans xiligouense TaxID=253184 RepID=A0A3N4Z888_9MICO|nr:hypothetical protein [Myceligenerans xiligouense]RPF21542.1 hypothetical protein EDD34_2173 [Myceligenerans xiligouense]
MTRPGTIVVAALLVGLAAAAALTGALAWTHALAGAIVVAVLVGVHRGTETTVEDPDWHDRPEETRTGGRHEVSDLGWAVLGGDGRVKDSVARRVRALALARLRRAGRDTTSLGVDLRERPTLRTLARWLDAIERIPDTPDERGPRA